MNAAARKSQRLHTIERIETADVWTLRGWWAIRDADEWIVALVRSEAQARKVAEAFDRGKGGKGDAG